MAGVKRRRLGHTSAGHQCRGGYVATFDLGRGEELLFHGPGEALFASRREAELELAARGLRGQIRRVVCLQREVLS